MPAPTHIDEFDGIRGIMSLLVVAMHTVQFYSIWFPMYHFLPEKPPRIDVIISHPTRLLWEALCAFIAAISSLGIDIFFIMAATIITLKFLEKQHEREAVPRTSAGNNSTRPRDPPSTWTQQARQLVARAIRLQSLVVVVAVMSSDQPELPNWPYTALFVNNYLPFNEQFVAISWSNAVLFQMSVLLPLILVVATRCCGRRHLPLVLVLCFVLASALRWREVHRVLGKDFTATIPHHLGANLPATQRPLMRKLMGVERFAWDDDPLLPLARQGWLANDTVYLWTHTRLTSFFVGALLALALGWQNTRAPLAAVVADSLFAASLLIFISSQFVVQAVSAGSDERAAYALQPAILGAAFAVMVFLAVQQAGWGGRSLSWCLRARPLRCISRLSYACYMLHFFPIAAFCLSVRPAWDVPSFGEAAFYVASTSALSLAVAFVGHYIVEQPFLWLAARVGGKPQEGKPVQKTQ
eukprot:m.489010 g.489010  ORF g.489010 m.489010 type:complete len:468 (+) comp26317_c0_seq1:265-1668(+)